MAEFSTDSEFVYNKEDYVCPLTHTGYLRKRGQRIKTWKRRYVVVELGRLTYFEKSNETNEPPFGVGLKGSLTLNGYCVEDGPKDTMLLLSHKTQKRELLIEVENGAHEAANWRALLEHHIQYCDENPHIFLQVGANFQEDEAKRAVAATKIRESLSRNTQYSFDDDGVNDDSIDRNSRMFQKSQLSAPVPIKPDPGFVIKTKRTDGLKVFINVCSHESIPFADKKKGNKRWPIMVLSPSYIVSVDKNAEECHVIDACVHSSVIEECMDDVAGEIKDELCRKIIEAIISRERKEKVECSIDKTTFSFPRLAKKYKGNEVASYLIPRNINEECKHISVFTAIDIEKHVDMDEIEDEEEPIDINTDPFAHPSQPAAMKHNDEASQSSLRKQITINGSENRKKFITFNVERKTGAIIREKPDKTSARVKTLLRDTKTYCYGRIISADEKPWYRVLDGWTLALTDGGQRMLKPICAEQPNEVFLTGVNLVEKEEKGLIFSSVSKKLTFSLELYFPREAKLRLQRSYEDFFTLYDGLRQEHFSQSDVEFPEYVTEELKNNTELDAELILGIMRDLEIWLRRTIEDISIDLSPPLRVFFQCNEADCVKIDMDLSAGGGLDGAWSMDY